MPHFSRDTQLTFHYHADKWVTSQRLKFQEVMVKFFNLYFIVNSAQTAISGPWNVEVLRVRMGEDELGHRVPDVSVLHWRLWYVGYGFLQRSAELTVQDAYQPHLAYEMYKLIAEVGLDVVVDSMTSWFEPDVPKCHSCTANTALPYLGSSPYMCAYTVDGEPAGGLGAKTWNPELETCEPVNDNYKIEPLGGFTFSD